MALYTNCNFCYDLKDVRPFWLAKCVRHDVKHFSFSVNSRRTPTLNCSFRVGS